MDPSAGVMILTGVLVLVTAYYAWTIRRFLGTFQDMVVATREMAETASRTYALSVVPRVECRTVSYEVAQDRIGEAAGGQTVSETTITNVGAYKVRLSRVRLETDSEGEQVRRFALRAGDVLITKDSESWTDIAVPAVVSEGLPDVLCGYHLAHIRPADG